MNPVNADLIYSEIIQNNAEYESHFSEYACRSKEALRKEPVCVDSACDIRPAFFHDTDRIIHSRAYSRYIDKTQVFYLYENDHITHRVLHVQLVSKIARVIGRSLRLNEDLIEAIALGHDLGHVPYGHDGEKILNDLCNQYEIGCFTHNAQSARFLMELENKGKGLNLTLQTLDGILAHNGEKLEREYHPDYEKTWEEFGKEYSESFKNVQTSQNIVPMTLEGCVVKVSDVIAYIGRDIEDAITLNIIKREEIPSRISSVLGNTNSQIIDALVRDVILNSYGKDSICFSEKFFTALNDLKDFNYKFIYNTPKIKTKGLITNIERMYHLLFEKYLSDLKEADSESSVHKSFLSDMDSSYRENTPPERMIVDFLSGMTDDYFNMKFTENFVPQKR